MYDGVANKYGRSRKSYLSCQLSKHALERVINVILSDFILMAKNKKHKNKI